MFYQNLFDIANSKKKMKRPKFKAKVDIDCRYSNTLIYEVSVTTNGHQIISFPQMSLDELKELNEVIYKFLKDENI